MLRLLYELIVLLPLFLFLGAFYSPKAGSVTIAASARPYNNWELELKCEVVDVTNFTSGGYNENIAGLFSATVSFSGPYDGAESIAQGDSLAVTLVGGSGAPSFAPTVRISSIKVTADIKGALSIAVTGESNGSFSISI